MNCANLQASQYESPYSVDKLSNQDSTAAFDTKDCLFAKCTADYDEMTKAK